MTGGPRAERPRAAPFAAAPGLPLAVFGLVALAAVVTLLPFLGDGSVTLLEQALSYVLAVLPSGVLVYGLLALFDTYLRTSRLLLLGAAAGAGGALAAQLGGDRRTSASSPLSRSCSCFWPTPSG